MTSRRMTAAACVTCFFTMLSGCATVPTGGPVIQGEGRNNPLGLEEPYIGVTAVKPQEGISEHRLVTDFLSMLGSFEDDYSAARAYLTPQQGAEWNPDGTALVYDSVGSLNIELVESDQEAGTAEMRLRTPQVATIDSDGQYVAAPEGSSIDVRFRLVKVEGEWRIDELPDQLILSRREVERVYRPLNVYFFNQTLSTLVADPVFLPVHSANELPERLVESLVDGPTSWLASAVRTSFPTGTSVDASYESGRMTVDLGSKADNVDADTRHDMVAQLVWTLKQLPEVQRLRLRIGGDEVNIPESQDETLQTSGNAWSAVDPAGLDEDARAYFMRDGQLFSLQNGTESRVRGAPGSGEVPLEGFAVSLNERWVASVTADHHDVRIAELSGGSQYTTVLSGGTYTALSWDGYGNLWVVEDLSPDSGAEEDKGGSSGGSGGSGSGGDSGSGEPGNGGGRGAATDKKPKQTAVWMLRGGTDPVQVSAPELERENVTALRASRDGTRVAVLTEEDSESRLSMGRIVIGGGDVALERFLPLGTDLEEVADVAWRSGDQLCVLGRGNRGATQAYLVPLDGSSEATSAGAVPGADMESVTCAPGQPLLSGADDSWIWLTNDRLMWQRVFDGANPVYPG